MRMQSGFFVAFLLASPAVTGGIQEEAAWGKVFDEHDANGTIVIVDQRSHESVTRIHDQERAGRRFSPASTFKIPHTLFALDTGVVDDEFQVFEWDGVERSFEGHNRDQDLRSAMRSSAIWLYQQFADGVGESQANEYLARIEYGNAVASSESGDYWVYGDLAISTHEQIDFLQRLYRNELPFEVQHQRLVKDLIIVEAGWDWILRAKTGWDGRIGWWVGWVEWPQGPVFFALNIDTPNRFDDLAKRQQVAREILRSIDALPTP
jgi:beta-lactamase class D